MKTSPQHFQWILLVALSLTQGGVTLKNAYQLELEVLVECIVKSWLGHKALPHHFDSRNFVLSDAWVLKKTFE